MKSIQNLLIHLILVIFVFSFILFYPMFISIYVFLPLMIGIMGFLMIKGIEKHKISYILIPFLYLINLEINLSLPIFLTLVSILTVYVIYINSFIYKIKCNICKAIFITSYIDILYLGLLLGYDFIFQTKSIVIDEILLYSLIIDLIISVIL